MRNILFAFFVLAFACNALAQNSLKVEVHNIKDVKGKLVVALYKGDDGFLEEGKQFRKKILDVTRSSMNCHFTDLPQGEYAIAIHHDKNEDAKMNTNLLGIPQEAYGFSNNVKPRLKAPSFQKTSFEINDYITQKINLIH